MPLDEKHLEDKNWKGIRELIIYFFLILFLFAFYFTIIFFELSLFDSIDGTKINEKFLREYA